MAITPPSTPPSPSSPAQVPPTTTNNDLSDIFSDSPPSTPAAQPSHPSDIPRLRSTHATAGYRAGISSSKTQSLQPGFDEGYSLGAVFGLRVGYILGALEGLWGSYDGQCEEKDRLRRLLREAREELKIERVFGKEFWGEDGVWTYEVVGTGEEATFLEVAVQHPVIRKWDGRIGEEVRRAGVKVGRFEGSDWEAGRVGEEVGR